MTYELKTIKDIFEKIPEDRIEDCMAELTVLILQAKRVHNLFLGMVKNITDKDTILKFPEFVEWIDDKKGDITIGIRNKVERIMSFGYKMEDIVPPEELKK